MIENNIKNIFTTSEKAIRQMKACGLSHSAKDIEKLLEYAKEMDKIQKKLVKLVLNQQRDFKALEKLIERIYISLGNGARNIIDVWLEDLKNNAEGSDDNDPK